MDTKIVLTINGATKEEFNLVVTDQQSINDLLWQVRIALKEKLYGRNI